MASHHLHRGDGTFPNHHPDPTVEKNLADLKQLVADKGLDFGIAFPVDESRKFAVIEEVRARLSAQGADVNSMDGVRVNTGQGWWLLRAFNTQDVLVARAEASSEDDLEQLLAALKDQLGQSGIKAVWAEQH